MLPSDYSAIIADGVRALRETEPELRARAERETDAPELWLTVRDVNSLAGRLRESDDWAWQTGTADAELSPADLGVLAALRESGGDESPYRAETRSGPRAAAISALHDFLIRYMDGGFEFEDVKTYRSAAESPAS